MANTVAELKGCSRHSFNDAELENANHTYTLVLGIHARSHRRHINALSPNSEAMLPS